ncbi:MAG: M48 family metalloprotease [Candidatus Dependentiae bacterium]|nr:M48 family metalloprotease [Candidatus Dependentiae bacterium]
MISSMLLQQALGVFNLSIPLIFLAYGNPTMFRSRTAIVLCSLAMGGYVGYLNYSGAQSQTRGLHYYPSQQYQVAFDKEISACGLNPDTIDIRYAYAGDGIAMAQLNTVIIDPRMWKNIEHDAQVKSVYKLLEPVVAALPENTKELHKKINTMLTEDAQRFIFRHELGHIYHNYSIKKIIICGVIGACVAFVGIGVACLLMSYPIAAIMLGMLAGGTTDVCLSYSSNALFTYYEEKKADMFAARYSTAEEIHAAAQFFAACQEISNEYKKEHMGLLAHLPQAVASGHPDGATRANYLMTV